MGVLDNLRNWREQKKAAAQAEVASWRLGRKFLYLTLIALLLGVLYCWAIWSLNYSTGSRAGTVRKLSHRGMVFKTWEGELQMSGILAPADNGHQAGDVTGQMIQGGNVWLFSVDENKKDVIAALEQAAAKGERVLLHYDEKYKGVFFRGDTKYFITKVEAAQ
ncbi:MAG: hypothetical protein RL757_1486 [Bacteroidota bacterium]|jgi:hypothetical protein